MHILCIIIIIQVFANTNPLPNPHTIMFGNETTLCIKFTIFNRSTSFSIARSIGRRWSAQRLRIYPSGRWSPQIASGAVAPVSPLYGQAKALAWKFYLRFASPPRRTIVYWIS